MQEHPIHESLYGTLDRLVRTMAPEAVILFGSRAKGAARPGSDIDLLVIARATGDAEFHLRQARQVAARSFPRVDLVLCTPGDVEQAQAGKLPFVQSAIETGIVLYRRP